MSSPKRRAHSDNRSEEERAAHALGFSTPRTYTPRQQTEVLLKRIREVATDLYAERGLNGVSLADVSREVRLGPTHLQYYFGKREHLLYDILFDHSERLLGTANAAALPHRGATDEGDGNAADGTAGRAEPGVAWARAMVAALLGDIAGKERNAHRVLRNTLHVLPRLQRDALEQRLGYLRYALSEPLCVAMGLPVTESRLDEVARLALAMIGDIAAWDPTPDAAALDRLAGTITGMALHGALLARDAAGAPVAAGVGAVLP